MIPPDPIERFRSVYALAEKIDRSIIPEPNAMSLGTIEEGGQPSVRIVLLKGFDERGFVFYTNYEGRKGRELLAHPKAALCFYWPPLDIQVRIEGTVTKVPDKEADAYFATRPIRELARSPSQATFPRSRRMPCWPRRSASGC